MRSLSACLALLAAQGASARPLIVIHMSKTGGTSIEETLGITNKITNWETPSATIECERIPIMDKRFLKHDTAQVHVAKSYYTDAEWAAAFKFSIVPTGGTGLSLGGPTWPRWQTRPVPGACGR